MEHTLLIKKVIAGGKGLGTLSRRHGGDGFGRAARRDRGCPRNQDAPRLQGSSLAPGGGTFPGSSRAALPSLRPLRWLRPPACGLSGPVGHQTADPAGGPGTGPSGSSRWINPAPPCPRPCPSAIDPGCGCTSTRQAGSVSTKAPAMRWSRSGTACWPSTRSTG